MPRTKTMLLPAALLMALAACEESATGPRPGEATMQVAVVGDGGGAPQSAGSGSQALSGAEGTVEFRARVLVRSSTGAWINVTNGAVQETVDASGRGGAQVVATTGLAAGSYNRVRVEFERVQANVQGGVWIGTGLLTGTVRVDLQGDERVVVEREVSVAAGAGATTRLLVDLNADAWLGQASAQTRTVSEAAFASAVVVTAR